MRSIKWKLVVIYLTIVFVVMVTCGTFIVVRIESLENSKAKGELEQFGKMIEAEVVVRNDPQNFQDELTKWVRETPTMGLFQGSILDSKNKTLATTIAFKNNEAFPEFKNSAIVTALSGTPEFGMRKFSIDGTNSEKDWLFYAAPVWLEDKTTIDYVVFVQMDVSTLQDNLSKTKQTVVITITLALFLTAFIGLLFSSTLTGPIILLTKKSKELARGKLHQEIEVKSNDEIGQLTKSFNYMAKELSNTVSTIKREKNKLEIVLHTMTDGVIAFDLSGKIQHANSISYDMLGVSSMEQTFEMILQKFDITRSRLKEIKLNETKKVSFELGEKYLNASFTMYGDILSIPEGIVIVLQDATEQKRLDEMRKEFVANVSHELRTPLTTIKSYTETLMDGGIEDASISHEFLEVIDSEADRMTTLVKDLLQLSRFDSKQITLSFEQVSIKKVIKDCLKQTRVLAEQKRIKIISVQTDDEMTVTADPDRINQVLNNILVNAIKYSPEDSSVNIYTVETDRHYKIYVKDNGMGIPKEDLPRIFERFYRVDKARSRAMGGTGLGLSIAKEIMEKHHGKITVESEISQGTTMIIWLRKN